MTLCSINKTAHDNKVNGFCRVDTGIMMHCYFMHRSLSCKKIWFTTVNISHASANYFNLTQGGHSTVPINLGPTFPGSLRCLLTTFLTEIQIHNF